MTRQPDLKALRDVLDALSREHDTARDRDLRWTSIRNQDARLIVRETRRLMDELERIREEA